MSREILQESAKINPELYDLLTKYATHLPANGVSDVIKNTAWNTLRITTSGEDIPMIHAYPPKQEDAGKNTLGPSMSDVSTNIDETILTREFKTIFDLDDVGCGPAFTTLYFESMSCGMVCEVVDPEKAHTVYLMGSDGVNELNGNMYILKIRPGDKYSTPQKAPTGIFIKDMPGVFLAVDVKHKGPKQFEVNITNMHPAYPIELDTSFEKYRL